MAVNATHPDYDTGALDWSPARDVLSGEDAVMRWVYWWNSTERIPELVTDGQVLLELNTDFGVSGMQSGELAAVVSAWKDGAMSQDSMLELFRKREMLPEGHDQCGKGPLH